jgi:hypothetical protein
MVGRAQGAAARSHNAGAAGGAVRTDASERLWDQIVGGVDVELRWRLNALFEVEEGWQFSVQ